VPGAAKPDIHVTPNGVAPVDGAVDEAVDEATDTDEVDVAGAEARDEELQPVVKTAMHMTATVAGRT
jgi:hypothetical protein